VVADFAALAADVERAGALAWTDEAGERRAPGADPRALIAMAVIAAVAMAIAASAGTRGKRRAAGGRAASIGDTPLARGGGVGASTASWTCAASSPQKSDAAQYVAESEASACAGVGGSLFSLVPELGSGLVPPMGMSSSSDSSHWRGRRRTTLLEGLEPFLPSGF
jgi:hypothetical protein